MTIHEAAARGDSDAIWDAMDEEIDVPDEVGWSPLMVACEAGHLVVVKTILRHGGRVNVNHTDVDGWTALMIASARGHAHIVSVLLGVEGIDKTHADADGMTALSVAEARGHKFVASLLRG